MTVAAEKCFFVKKNSQPIPTTCRGCSAIAALGIVIGQKNGRIAKHACAIALLTSGLGRGFRDYTPRGGACNIIRRGQKMAKFRSIMSTSSDARIDASGASVPIDPRDVFLEIQSRILCYQGDVKSLGESYPVRKWMNARRELRKARREMRLLIRKRNGSLAFNFLK